MVSELAKLLEDRIGQDFDGECHLTEQEAHQVVAALRAGGEPVVVLNTGIDAAIAFVRKRCDAYVAEHGIYDPDTGATEFPGNGDETVCEWEEIIEGLERLHSTASVPQFLACEDGEFNGNEVVAMTVIDHDQWEPCSPVYLEKGGNCKLAPRVWNARDGNHWHPKLPASPAPSDLERELAEAQAEIKRLKGQEEFWLGTAKLNAELADKQRAERDALAAEKSVLLAVIAFAQETDEIHAFLTAWMDGSADVDDEWADWQEVRKHIVLHGEAAKQPIAAISGTSDPLAEARRHAVELEQCAIFAADVGPSIAKAMTDAAAWLRQITAISGTSDPRAEARREALEEAARIAEQFGPSRPIVAPRPTEIIRGRWEGEQAASGGIATAIRAGYTIVGPADVEKAVEAGAAAVDPEIWAMDTPPPTRADIEAFHARRRKSVEIAKAVLTAASPHMPVPAGWVLVPEEPTREMYKAASDNFVPPADAAAAWYAMISSRPKGATHER